MIVKERFDKKYKQYEEAIFRKVIKTQHWKAHKLNLKLEKQNLILSKLLQEYNKRFG